MLSTKDLIEKVQKRPVIWDRNCTEYRLRSCKEAAWVEICEEFMPTFRKIKDHAKVQIVAKITKKWYNVRDSYVKSLKYRKERKRAKPYLYSDLLTFLDPIYSAGEEKTEEDEPLDFDNHDDNASEIDSEPYMNEIYLDQTVDENEVNPAKIAKIDFSKSQDSVEESTNMFVALSSLIEREEDEDRAFFNSITPTVKTLSKEAKMDFRIEVMKLLKRMKGTIKYEKDPMD